MILLYEAPDVPGTWIAHDTDVDVVTQGESLDHALEMVKEAKTICVEADREAGLDPAGRRVYPEVRLHCKPMANVPSVRTVSPMPSPEYTVRSSAFDGKGTEWQTMTITEVE